MTSPQLEKALGEELTDERELVLDLTPLQYISSAGLRHDQLMLTDPVTPQRHVPSDDNSPGMAV